MRTTRRWLGSLALAALAVQGLGCELIFVAIASATDDEPPIIDEPTPLCASVMSGQFNSIFDQPDFGEVAEEGVHLRVAGNLAGKGLATSDSVALFFTIATDVDDYQPIDDLDVSFEGSGNLEAIEWEVCPTLFDQAIVVAHPKTVGNGKIKVFADGDELRTYSFDVAEPTSMTVTVDFERSRMEAQLFDDAGNVLYANDILWQLAPFSGTQPSTYGNLAALPETFGTFAGGPGQEVIVTASRGTLSASLTLKLVDGAWQVVSE